MAQTNSVSRRVAVKTSLFGLISVSIPNLLLAKNASLIDEINAGPLPDNKRYPAIDEAVVSAVVGVAHFDLDQLKKLVDPRPELARATWDWGFGDWESAIGAASHVARKDIATYLISKGARPDIFTFAMLGSFNVVRSMIEFSPGIQKISGPHGISLLQHAKNGLANSSTNNSEAIKLVAYLESLGDADSQKYPLPEEQEKQLYIGDYKYGDGETDGLSVKLNMRKMISLGKLGKSGGALNKIGAHKFTYNGSPSVIIDFLIENGKVVSLTIAEPGLVLLAKKI